MAFPRALTRYTRGAVNRMTLRFAGHAAFADLTHVGRKTGIVRHTPVRAFRTGDMVVIGLNFGRQSDWYKNIKTAGTCRIRLGHEQLTLGPPRIVPVEQGTKGAPWLLRVALRHVVHTTECVELPVLAGRPAQQWPTSRSETGRDGNLGRQRDAPATPTKVPWLRADRP